VCHFLPLRKGGLISALKPGPVVPPGTQKVPDQAARKTQTVDFGHLSDILAFLGGGQFLMIFLSFFSDFNFITFSVFLFFDFVTFFTFLIFVFFLFLCFDDFDQFLLFFMLMINFCHFLSLN